MPRNLAAIRVQIGLRASGDADYPNFNMLPSVIATGKDWSLYVDQEGEGWMYDAVGHREEEVTDPPSPVGTQWGVLLIPKQFAVEAIATFPTRCTRLTQVQLEAFYNTRVARDEPEDEVDVEVLQQIKAKDDLGIRRTREDNEALHPSHPRRGVRANPRKSLTRLMSKRAITIDETA